MSGFREKGLSAVIWSFAEKMGAQIILLINAIVLARLLNPVDFGIFAMITIFINISTIFVDSGMGGGLVRKKNLTDDDCTTFFIFNITVAIILYFLLFLAAPLIADFYNQPSITKLLRILGLTIIFNSFSLIHRIHLIKDLNFKKLAKFTLFSAFFSVIISMVMAFKGYGIWSLIGMQVAQSIISTILLVVFSKWASKGSISKKSFKELYAFGIGLFLSSLINTIFRSIYQPLIGKFFSPIYAGFYFQANKLFEVPFLTLSSVVDSVTYPLLVKVQDNHVTLKITYQKIFLLLLFISIPLVVLISILSKSIIIVLLGEKWLFSAVLLKIIAISGIFIILETANRSLYKIYGYTQLIFRLEVLKKVLILIVIYYTYKYGMIVFMYGLVFNALLSFIINQYFSPIKLAGYKEIFLMLVNGLLMSLIALYVTLYFTNNYIIIIVGSGLALILYTLMASVFNLSSFNFLLNIIKRKLSN